MMSTFVSHFTAFPLIGLFLTAGAFGCGEPPPDNNGAVVCGKGQVIQYDPQTGAPLCVTATDTGNIDDGANLGETSGSDTGISVADASTDGAVNPDSQITVADGDATATPDGTETSGTDVQQSDVVIPKQPTSFKCPLNTPKVANKNGTACLHDSDCMYGACYFGSPLSGYDTSFGVCAKNCACTGAPNVNCYDDDSKDGTETYKCVTEMTNKKGLGNPMHVEGTDPIKMCARVCKNDGDCASINPALPHCILQSTKYLSTPPVGVCGMDPFKS